MKYVTSVERLAIERGKRQGIQQGIQQGIEQGIEKGELRGQANVLIRQLSKRFGPLSTEASQRLQTATAEQLELWADRILDATTLAAVFDAH
jgi:flagellar biosynthesis/type III secretory pathway protein FliH